MSKPSIFILHITAERTLAFALKRIIENSYLGMADIFVSSDPNDLPAGKLWPNQIIERLQQAAICFVFISKQSLRRNWISYEAGAASIRNIPMIPLCHSGVSVRSLPAPFSFHQAVDVGNEESLRLIIPTVSRALNSNDPNVDFSELVNTVRTFEKESEVFAGNDISLDDISASPPKQLPEYVMKCLNCLGDLHYEREGTSVALLKNEFGSFGYTDLSVNLALRILKRSGLVECTVENLDSYSSHSIARITDAGWTFIEKNIDAHELNLGRIIPPSPVDSFYDGDSEEKVPF